MNEYKQNGIKAGKAASDREADQNNSLGYPKNGRREMADRMNPGDAQDDEDNIEKGDHKEIHPLHPDIRPYRQALKENTDRDLLALDEGKGGSHRGRVNKAERDKLLPADDRGFEEVTQNNKEDHHHGDGEKQEGNENLYEPCNVPRK